MTQIPITRAGYEKLKKELEHIKMVLVPQNIKEIEVARAHGDISENAEFAAAKERQSFIQGKIQEIENNLAHSHIIDLSRITNERVVFGATVTFEEDGSGETFTYQLVGPLESNIGENKISVTSPLGKALIGKREGDVVTVKTPRGTRTVEITEIRIEQDRP